MKKKQKLQKEYIDSLYSKSELKVMKEKLGKIKNHIINIDVFLEKFDYLISELMDADEEKRIIIKHFKLKPNDYTKIIDSYRKKYKVY